MSWASQTKGRRMPGSDGLIPGTERMLDLSRVAGGGTSEQSNAEQERPYPAASSGKDRAYKAGWLKSRGAGRESERPKVPRKACKTTRWREGALL